MVMSSMLYITESETQYSSVNWDENKIYQLEVEVVNDSSALSFHFQHAAPSKNVMLRKIMLRHYYLSELRPFCLSQTVEQAHAEEGRPSSLFDL